MITGYLFIFFKKITLRTLLVTLFTLLLIHSFGQLMLDDINLELVRQRSVRKYIECQIDEGRHEFCELQPSCSSETDLSSYRKKEMTFFLNGNFADIWQGYVSADPSISWDGRKISFGLLLLKFPARIFYNHDPITGVDLGQVYLLKLKLLLGIYNIPVAFEIITVDQENKVIEFSYLEGNKSNGVQQVKFVDLGDERTEIIHTSYYKSDSRFRDKWMYPHFHKIIINDFHRNMRRLLKEKNQAKERSADQSIFEVLPTSDR
jgi:hypothetical protein